MSLAPEAVSGRSERPLVDPPLRRGLRFRRGDRLRREGAVLAWWLVWRPRGMNGWWFGRSGWRREGGRSLRVERLFV